MKAEEGWEERQFDREYVNDVKDGRNRAEDADASHETDGRISDFLLFFAGELPIHLIGEERQDEEQDDG